MLLYRALLLLSVVGLGSAGSILDQRQDVQCNTASYVPCLPPTGTQANTAPDALDWYGEDWLFGSTMSGIGSLGGVRAMKRQAPASHLSLRQTTGYLCCPTTDSWTCQVLPDYNIPYCYQSTTTQFQLADGSYGYSSTGEYFLPSGDQINFNTGDYKLAGGRQGNIYVDHGMSPPSSSGGASTPTATAGASGASGNNDVSGQSTASAAAGGSTASGAASGNAAADTSFADANPAMFTVAGKLFVLAEMVLAVLVM